MQDLRICIFNKLQVILMCWSRDHTLRLEARDEQGAEPASAAAHLWEADWSGPGPCVLGEKRRLTPGRQSQSPDCPE